MQDREKVGAEAEDEWPLGALARLRVTQPELHSDRATADRTLLVGTVSGRLAHSERKCTSVLPSNGATDRRTGKVPRRKQ